MTPVPEPAAVLNTARLRSGTAARLAGVPVATLRVWERRYGVVAAPKTATGQRLYSAHDVQRLRLLKQLSDRGHAIGSMANLPLDALLARAVGDPAHPAEAADSAEADPTLALRRVVVVGRQAAHKLKSVAGCTLQALYDDLDAADTGSAAVGTADLPSEALVGVDLLLVHLPSLQPAAARQVLALGIRLQARAIVVLYAFGTEAVAEQLRAAGVGLRREPVSAHELGRLIAQTLQTPEPAAAVAPALALALALAAPRRFSDAALATLAELPSAVACECPRHVAEIVMQLVGFERYSADCGSRSPADAVLHQHLSAVAGQARALFEQALAQVMAAEGIVLPVSAGAA